VIYSVQHFMRLTGMVAAILVGAVNAASSQMMITAPDDLPTLYAYCQQFQTLYIEIRQQSVEPDSARARFSEIMSGLQNRFRAVSTDSASSTKDTASISATNTNAIGSLFTFPLRGYGPNAIGGTHGEGYRGHGFDLFDYSVKGSHPAQDIFIEDRNQDDLEDTSEEPVSVLAMSSGLVLAIETGWQPGSEYRGGNWIWIYDPARHGLFYYAHNRAIFVTPGQWVSSGQQIAEVGRTGYNAFPKRSPTHLHLMYLQIQADGLPTPENPYQWLLGAKVSK
jgi:peptidoglycan LD-endopeptidase LytH